MDSTIIAWVVGAVLTIGGLMFASRDEKKIGGMKKGLVVAVMLILGIGLLALQLGWLQQLNPDASYLKPLAVGGATAVQAGTGASTTGGSGVISETPNYQPTATYATQDAFSSSTAVSGTAYYKQNGLRATSTAITNVNSGTTYTYWMSNSSTYYVEPYTFVATDGANGATNSKAYANSTTEPTIVLFSALNNANVQSGKSNVTLGAGGTENIVLKYQGIYQKSNAPFGGALVVEVNQTIASVTCTGNGLSTSNPYKSVTYTVSATDNKYVVFSFDKTIDDGSSNVKEFNCQFKNGASDTSSDVKFTFIPANYYLSKSGEFLLDIEKSADSDTTKTGLGVIDATMYFT